METLCHLPVMADEVVSHLVKDKSGIYVDGTLGGGGHTSKILEKLSSEGRVVCIDWDEDAITIAKERLKPYAERIITVRGNFADIRAILRRLKISLVDGILLDLGISSIQLEKEGRGFSFLRDEPLDMRMDRRLKRSAYHIINELPEEELRDIFLSFGEERYAKRIAKKICIRRRSKSIETTKELADLIVSVMPYKYRRRIHPATKVFQALRIAVNDEIDNLKRVILEGTEVLKPQGRFCIITFHSLEDRIVKDLFRSFEKGCICPIGIPRCVCGREPKLKVITKKPVRPSLNEIAINLRARSAKLRVAERVV